MKTVEQLSMELYRKTGVSGVAIEQFIKSVQDDARQERRVRRAKKYLTALLHGTFDKRLGKRMGDRRDIPLWACDLVHDALQLIP